MYTLDESEVRVSHVVGARRTVDAEQLVVVHSPPMVRVERSSRGAARRDDRDVGARSCVVDIFSDLAAEDDRLESILESLDDDAWLSHSSAPGWSVADVVLHLAQTDESVVATAATSGGEPSWRTGPQTVDELMEVMVREERAAPAEVFARWKVARREALSALRSADPARRLQWAAAPLKPATLATTRIAEHWAHGLDIVVPLGIDFPDTDRLRHIAWLGHNTLPYAFALASLEPQPVYCELTGPFGDTWCFGPTDASSRIVGEAGEFCRVGAQRLAPEASHLVASGPHGATALKVLRNYAS